MCNMKTYDLKEEWGFKYHRFRISIMIIKDIVEYISCLTFRAILDFISHTSTEPPHILQESNRY